MRRDYRNMGGAEEVEVELYDMPGKTWDAITDVPCPVEGCKQTLVWYEAGYVPGYRVCMAETETEGVYYHESIRHRFQLDHWSETAHPFTLIREV